MLTQRLFSTWEPWLSLPSPVAPLLMGCSSARSPFWKVGVSHPRPRPASWPLVSLSNRATPDSRFGPNHSLRHPNLDISVFQLLSWLTFFSAPTVLTSLLMMLPMLPLKMTTVSLTSHQSTPTEHQLSLMKNLLLLTMLPLTRLLLLLMTLLLLLTMPLNLPLQPMLPLPPSIPTDLLLLTLCRPTSQLATNF